MSRKSSTSKKKLLKELPPNEKMEEIMTDLKAYGPQATALLGAAYLEHAIELMLRATYRELSKEEDQRIFDGASGGILGSFSAKIRMAYAQKLIHPKVQEALLLINDIRNVFAHSLHRIDFNHEAIENDCVQLAKISPSILSAAGLPQIYSGESIDIYSKIVTMLYHSVRQKVEDLKDGAAAQTP